MFKVMVNAWDKFKNKCLKVEFLDKLVCILNFTNEVWDIVIKKYEIFGNIWHAAGMMI